MWFDVVIGGKIYKINKSENQIFLKPKNNKPFFQSCLSLISDDH